MSDFVMERRTLAAAVLFLALPAETSGRSQVPAQGQTTELVQGILVMHWEHPHFVRKDAGGEQVYEPDLSLVRWKEKHLPPLTPDSALLTPLFCVSARGYVDTDRLGQTGRTTFVFTEITSTLAIDGEGECARQPGKL